MRIRTRAAITVAALVAATVVPVLGAGPAQAVTYRYWTYWWGDGTGTSHTGWKFASVGPSGQTVADKAVLGWRFATTKAAGTTSPRFSSSYSSVCSDPVPAAGQVRVAVVVDFGSSSDWPPGERPPVVGKVYTRCITVPTGTRASTALSDAQLDLRIGGNGLICGINGFPATECAPVISDPAPTPTPTRTATRTPTPSPTRSSGTGTSGTTPSSSRSASTAPAPSSSTSGSATSAPAASSASVAPSASGGALAGTGASPSPSSSDESALPATTDAPVASSTPAGASSTPWGAIGGLALVAAVGGAAWFTMRRGGAR